MIEPFHTAITGFPIYSKESCQRDVYDGLRLISKATQGIVGG